MKFLEIAKKRYSCRDYKSNHVEDEKLMLVLEAARVAPSAVNFQPWNFIVMKSPESKAKVCEAYSRDWLKSAPVIIVVCGDHTKAWKRKDGKDHTDIDISIAVDHMTLQATEAGLATCWICAFNAEILKKNLELPDEIEPVVILPLGYPNDSSNENRHDKLRKSSDEIIHWEGYKKK
jgi:nitroreductase